jgi:polyisoprenoid-binding protein YceI
MSKQSSRIDLPSLVGNWGLVGDGSTVRFRATVFWGLLKVKGKFNTMTGRGSIDSEGLIYGDLSIDASSIDTGNVKRDTHLRSQDFFDVAQNPAILFELERVRPSSEGLLLAGTLSILGNVHPVEVDAQLEEVNASELTIRSTLELDRSRWGVDFKKKGMTKMATDLEISLHFIRVRS